MAIQTNHSRESLKPDSGVLKIDATGALALPVGTSTQRPLGAAGHIRFDQTTTKPEYFDGSVWDIITSKTYVDTADQDLQNQINNIISNIDPAALDSLAEIVQAFQNSDGTLTDAINALSNTLSTDLEQEVIDRVAADDTLQTNLDNIETSLQNQINNIISNIDPAALDSLAEIVQAFQNSDNELLTAINNLIANVSADLDQERIAADQELKDTIDSLTLDSLVDVTINTPTTGQVLTYDLLFGEFRNQTHQFSFVTKNYVADGVSASFDLNETVASQNNLVVSVNGILQQPGYSYTLVNNDTLIFDEIPELGDYIGVRIIKSSSTNDRPRPTVTGISYGLIGNYTTISITATDITFGTGAKIDNDPVTRIDYPTPSTMQLMIETARTSLPAWNYPRNLTLIDTSGNEFVFPNLINYGASKPKWTNSNSYIGTFSGGDTINFALPISNATSISIDPAYAGESAVNWLSISGNSIVGTAPNNSNPSRYEFLVTAKNGNVEVTKNFWLLVL